MIFNFISCYIRRWAKFNTKNCNRYKTNRAAAIGSPCLQPRETSKNSDIFPAWLMQALKLWRRILIHFVKLFPNPKKWRVVSMCLKSISNNNLFFHLAHCIKSKVLWLLWIIDGKTRLLLFAITELISSGVFQELFRLFTFRYRVSQKTWEFSDEFDIVFSNNSLI